MLGFCIDLIHTFLIYTPYSGFSLINEVGSSLVIVRFTYCIGLYSGLALRFYLLKMSKEYYNTLHIKKRGSTPNCYDQLAAIVVSVTIFENFDGISLRLSEYS
ncbi:hypothetical protein H8356DRAFT_1430105 [Neocallimastix lanati (nom. inval.)]|nr:hypothetical protein H8356DRAFT_1430105 [Neocallimastix sp. JGI-2020a]